MPLKKINPTKTNSWKTLEDHFKQIKDVEMKTLFKGDPDRKENFSLAFDEFKIDISKNRITEKTLKHLLDLANETELKDAIEKYFIGDKINETEGRAVLHTALRN